MGLKRSKRRKASDHHSKNSKMLLSEKTWSAIFFLRRTMSIPPTATEKNQVMEDLKSSNMELDESKLRMGNPEGISILERLDQLDGYDDEMYLIRATVLDDWSFLRDPATVADRNITAHGGRVKMDAATIRKYSENTEDDNRLQNWKNSFHRYYGIGYSDDIAGKLVEFHPYFLTVLNRRASVMAMRRWDKKGEAEKKKRIIDNANKIIQEWHENDGNGIFQENSCTMEYYRQIEKDWFSAL